jgi:hypothetical protein
MRQFPLGVHVFGDAIRRVQSDLLPPGSTAIPGTEMPDAWAPTLSGWMATDFGTA